MIHRVRAKVELLNRDPRATPDFLVWYFVFHKFWCHQVLRLTGPGPWIPLEWILGYELENILFYNLFGYEDIFSILDS